MLADFFGTDSFTFSLTNATVGITRSFEGFSRPPTEAAASRIFAGQHFRYDEDAGQELGAQVADFVFDHALLPKHTTAPAASSITTGPAARDTTARSVRLDVRQSPGAGVRA